MEDDFGDGWNGAAIQLEQAGTIMGEYTVPVDTVTYHVNLCAGDSIDIIFVSGSYDEECALTVTDDYTTNTIYSFAVANAPAAGVCHTFYNECGTVGVNEITESSMIYPNPAQNTVTLEGFGQINVVEVYNMNGQLVKQVTSDNERVDINTENLNNGVYLFRVISEKGVSNNNVMIAR
jgi:hypothetical protein